MIVFPYVMKAHVCVPGLTFRGAMSRIAVDATQKYFSSSSRKPIGPFIIKKTEMKKVESVLRVRKARVGDNARAEQLVRACVGRAWPGPRPLPASLKLVLADQLARTLAEGQSLVAEQLDVSRGTRRLVGLALGSNRCPWDARLLDGLAACLRCQKSRALIMLAASCLRDPNLHAKYSADRILQVFLFVNAPSKQMEISQILAMTAIKRGKESGYPLLRFDVTDKKLGEVLEHLRLTKEWELPQEKIKQFVPNESDATLAVYSVEGAKYKLPFNFKIKPPTSSGTPGTLVREKKKPNNDQPTNQQK